MKVNTRVRYGLRAIMQIAQGYGGDPVPISAIAASQEISNKYLEQIVGYLRRANLIIGHKGVRGGYSLARKPAEITLWDIMSALDTQTSLVSCVDEPKSCDRADECMTREIWTLLSDKMRDFWVGFNLATLVETLEQQGNRKLTELSEN